MTERTPIRIAAAGVGRLGMLHAQNLAHHVPGAELAVIVDVDEEAARRAGTLCGVTYTTDYAAVLADESIVAVEICTATDSHAEMIEAAARAGKHIFCEKPIALSLADADRAIAATEKAGVMLQIGFMRRYDPSYREAKRLIDSRAHWPAINISLVVAGSRHLAVARFPGAMRGHLRRRLPA